MEISVVIPVYNRETMILEALESVLAQTRLPDEIIVADDGSTDDTVTAVRACFMEKAGKISWQILELDHSGLAGAVRNRAVSASRLSGNHWIAFLDSDDLWEPEKLALQATQAASHPDLRLFHTRERWLRGDKTISQKGQKHKREGDIFTDALVKCIIGPSTVLIRRDLWEECGGFREDLEIAEDYELWLRLTAAERVGYLDTPLITKRAGDWEQLSEKYGQIEIFRLEGLESLLVRGWFREKAPRREEEARNEFRRKCEIYANGCEKRGRGGEAVLWRRKAQAARDSIREN